MEDRCKNCLGSERCKATKQTCHLRVSVAEQLASEERKLARLVGVLTMLKMRIVVMRDSYMVVKAKAISN